MHRLLAASAALVTAAAAAACGQGGPPDQFPGLSADVEILVDDMGIPHIYGRTDADVFFAAGYQMATDRLFQMELMRRRAHGRWSEILGASRFEDDRLARLFNWRDYGRKDAELLRARGGETYEVVRAFVAGVNRRIGEVNRGEAPLPYGFGPGELDFAPEPWDLADPLVVGRMVMFANDNSLEKELFVTLLAKLEPEAFAAVDLLTPMVPVWALPAEDRPPAPPDDAKPSLPSPPRAASAAVLRGAETRSPEEITAVLAAWHRAFAPLTVLGSNNWAVSGALSANGRPILANDPHQPLESPNLMYAMHLSSADGDGTIDVIGFGFAGMPGVQLGHNRDVAWAATTSFGDTMDVWEVDDLGDRVRFAGEELAVVGRTELIGVRGGEPLRFVAYDVPGEGVLLPDDLAPVRVSSPGRVLLFRWVGFSGARDLSDLLDYDRAATVEEFGAAADTLGAGFNFLISDGDKIAYHVGHVIPDRGDPAAGPAPWMVMDGADPAARWSGALLGADKKPHSVDPEQGFLSTANNDPFGFTANGRVDDDPWYYGAYFAPGFRAGRIDAELRRLAARGDITLEEMQALQLDTRSMLADELVLPLVEAVARIDSDDTLAAYRGRPELAALAARLAAWDRRMSRDAAEAVIFHAFVHFLSERVLRDELGVFYGAALELASVFVLKVTARTALRAYPQADQLMPEGRDLLLVAALADTADLLLERFGAVEAIPAWGELHGTAFLNAWEGSALDLPFVPADGGEDTVNVSTSAFFADDEPAMRWLGRHGALFRLVAGFDADGTPAAWVNMALGQVADPASPHFDDLLGDWVEGGYRRLRFRRADVEAGVESRLTLPAGAR